MWLPVLTVYYLFRSFAFYKKIYRHFSRMDSTFLVRLHGSFVLFVPSHRRVSFHRLTMPFSRNVVRPFAFSTTHILQAFTFFRITSFVTQICPTPNVFSPTASITTLPCNAKWKRHRPARKESVYVTNS